MHTRAGWAGACVSTGSVVVTAGPPIARSPDELADDGDELLGGEGLAQVLVGALTLTPHAIALLVLGAHEDHRHGLGASVALEAAQDLVAVAVGHDDVEEEQIRALLRHALLKLLAVGKTDDVVPGRFENALHQLQLRLGVVDHHHLGHRVTVLLVTLSFHTLRIDRARAPRCVSASSCAARCRNLGNFRMTFRSRKCQGNAPSALQVGGGYVSVAVRFYGFASRHPPGPSTCYLGAWIATKPRKD